MLKQKINILLRDDDVKDKLTTLDDEGRGNSYNFGARLYDPRVTRWFSLDPLKSKYPSVSPYTFALNNPVLFVDKDGKEPTKAAYQAAAEKLGVSVAKIRAVYLAEVGDVAYLSDGRLKILFEKHIFSQYTGGVYNESYPDISGKNDWAYGSFSAQYDKLEIAKSLDKDAAYKSISLGGYQIMGFNYETAGDGKFISAEEFVNAMFEGDENFHLQAFVNFIINDKFAPKPKGITKLQALREGDWSGFARVYNGPQYENGNYHIKMEKGFNKYKDDPYKGLVDDVETTKKGDE